jgi:alkylhydroperoxidase/carboxymuconolactone decarboxylase family protein YurZ
MNGKVSADALKGKGTLSPKIGRPIALGSAIVTQRGREMVESCVADCLKVGATREQIMEVLRLAIVVAEVPTEVCSKIVNEA